MTCGAAVHHFLNEHGLRTVAQAVCDVDQFSSLYQNLELRDQQPVDVSVVDNAHQSIAEVMTERGVYVEKRQANNVRAKRFSSIRIHFDFPRHRWAKEHQNTNMTGRRLFYELQPRHFVACASFQIRRENPSHHQENDKPQQRDSAHGVERDFHLTISRGQR